MDSPSSHRMGEAVNFEGDINIDEIQKTKERLPRYVRRLPPEATGTLRTGSLPKRSSPMATEKLEGMHASGTVFKASPANGARR